MFRFRQVDGRIVTPTYSSTTRIPVLNGRRFTDRDRATTEPVAVVVASYLPGRRASRLDPVEALRAE